VLKGRKHGTMSDDKLQLTACDYNYSEAAEDFAPASAAAVSAVDNDATDPPSYIAPAAEAGEIIEMRVSADQPSPSAVPVMQPGLDARPYARSRDEGDDESVINDNACSCTPLSYRVRLFIVSTTDLYI